MSDKGVTVKDFLPEERPQEKAEKFGIHTLTLSELWAVILRSGQPGVPITTLTRELMAQNDGKLRMLERRSRAELMQVPGIGPVKAVQIEAVLEVMRRYNSEKLGERYKIRNSTDVYNYMKPLAGHLEYEKIWILPLSRHNEVLGCEEISAGGMTATVFDLKLALKKVLLTPGCEGVIMCHNHPSGSLRPSSQDDVITKQMAEGSKYLGLKLIDHVIVTSESFYSYADNSRL